ncbi:MAG: helix-hairpin-helix domain-containing protein [Gelidibacter sp.]
MKSHFTFTKGQRNGIFLLLLIIIAAQCVYFFVDFPSEEIQVNQNELDTFQHEVDSLKLVEIETNKPKIYPFNPNYITDYKGYALGMSNEEIDRLLNFRKQNQWINSAKQFQEVTKVSDSMLNVLLPYFKFPEWVTKKETSNFKAQNPNDKWVDYSKTNKTKTFNQKIDLNTATAIQLQKVYGVGEKLSESIIRLRNKFVGGFIADVQLQDVYGLSPEVMERITNDFTVKTPRVIQKINLNTATTEQLVTIQHIDYQLAHDIIEQRTLRDGFQSLDDLTKVKNFPVQKIEIIKLYLTLN